MQKYLIPRPGVLVRDPDTMQHLRPEGEMKEYTSYWRGAVRDGDVFAHDSKPDHKKSEVKK
jgi:hypothetical protein